MGSRGKVAAGGAGSSLKPPGAGRTSGLTLEEADREVVRTRGTSLPVSSVFSVKLFPMTQSMVWCVVSCCTIGLGFLWPKLVRIGRIIYSKLLTNHTLLKAP